MTPVRLLELQVGGGHLLRLEYRERAAAKQLRPAHPPPASQLIELPDEVVIQLNQDFTTSHDHMVEHMETEPSHDPTKDEMRANSRGNHLNA